MVESQQCSNSKIFWLGHAGFKICFDVGGTTRVVYIDPWIGNAKYPDSLKNEAGESPMPTDADLILITHGHFDHAQHAPDLQKASTKEECKISCGFELSNYYKIAKGVPENGLIGCGKSGTIDLGWAKITQVSADHSSSCGFSEDGIANYAGAAAGWVLRLLNGVSVYHAGDTGVFSDMKIINDLYAPTHLLIPIGGHFTMGPQEAAYAVKHFLYGAHTIIPMHFLTFPLLKGDVPTFNGFLQEYGVEGKRVVDSYSEALGKWIDLNP